MDLLTVAQRVSPVALKAVVGTKADLQDSRQVTTQEALVSWLCLSEYKPKGILLSTIRTIRVYSLILPTRQLSHYYTL